MVSAFTTSPCYTGADTSGKGALREEYYPSGTCGGKSVVLLSSRPEGHIDFPRSPEVCPKALVQVAGLAPQHLNRRTPFPQYPHAGLLSRNALLTGEQFNVNFVNGQSL